MTPAEFLVGPIVACPVRNIKLRCSVVRVNLSELQARLAKAKPFVNVPETVSIEARKFLEALVDRATLPAWPARATWPAGSGLASR